MAIEPERVLFACVANSARSQMAEALLAARGGSTFAPASAGVVASGVHPLTVAVLAEIGIDWSAATSKALGPMLAQPWNVVITVCDEAAEACPYIPPPTRTLHWNFVDPAAVTGSPAERLAAFRRTREEIARRIDAFIAEEAP